MYVLISLLKKKVVGFIINDLIQFYFLWSYTNGTVLHATEPHATKSSVLSSVELIKWHSSACYRAPCYKKLSFIFSGVNQMAQ